MRPPARLQPPVEASVGRPGSRREGLLGAWCPAFWMETVRKCYVSRLQPSLCFSTFSHNRPTFFFFFFFLIHTDFSPQTFVSSSHSLPTFTAPRLRQQHSTLFHASPGVTDSKQHFSPLFFCSMENSCPYITLQPRCCLLALLFLSVSPSLTSLARLANVQRS